MNKMKMLVSAYIILAMIGAILYAVPQSRFWLDSDEKAMAWCAMYKPKFNTSLMEPTTVGRCYGDLFPKYCKISYPEYCPKRVGDIK